MIRQTRLQGPFLPLATRKLLTGRLDNSFLLGGRNIGLQLDKFGTFSLDDAGMQMQRDALHEVTRIHGDSRLLEMKTERRLLMLRAIGARRVRMRSISPLTLHLARAGTWDNAGICLHPISGFVFMPGSGIKGMVRAWAETVWAARQSDPELAWQRIASLFGYSKNSEVHKVATEHRGWRPQSVSTPEGSAAGRLVFHEAWPTTWPKLEVDIANVHHAKYYQGKDGPGDWDNPVPVYFLTVAAGTEFEFAVSDRERREDDSLDLAQSWLTGALQAEGAGSKTAAGYGRFVPTGSDKIEIPGSIAHISYELELISPAFLAGASQQQSDCILRGGTLRGLLRWWWRTLFTGHVTIDTLRSFEAAVWGGPSSGSPLRISVQPKKQQPAVRFEKGEHFLHNAGIAKRHGPSANLMGLYYTSYGMAENKNNRWCKLPNSTWQVSITARSGLLQLQDGAICKLEAHDLLKHASAALWLLTRYGGVGAKARKGFGSLRELSVDGIQSLEDCEEMAMGLLRELNMPEAANGRYAPSLTDAIQMPEVRTSWQNPWFACHNLGEIHRAATRELDKRERVVLGLPRKGQSVKGVDRHASAVHWSLGRNSNGQLLVRLLAFPSAKLPNWKNCHKALTSYVKNAARELDSCKRGRAAGPVLFHQESSPAPSSMPDGGEFPQAGDQVEVTLLLERTKKGKWKAQHSGSELAGVILDDLPSDSVPGHKIQLYVHSINAAREQIAFRIEPMSRLKKSRSSTKNRPSSRRSSRQKNR